MVTLSLQKEIQLYEQEIQVMSYHQSKNAVILMALKVELSKKKKRQAHLEEINKKV